MSGEDNGTTVRGYRVFIERSNGDLKRVWDGDARNSEHAARQAMKDNPKLRPAEVVTIPDRNYKTVPVKRNTKETISIG